MEIIYPIYVMVMLSFCVGIGLGVSRVKSIKNQDVNPKYYNLMQGNPPPDYSRKFERNFSNLFEVPVLFYVACIVAYVTDVNSNLLLSMAWGYVLLRAIHTIVHLTYNNTFHRFYVFIASNVVLVGMWIKIILVN